MPAACDQASIDGEAGRPGIGVHRLGVVLVGEGDDLRLTHAHRTDVDQVADVEVLEIHGHRRSVGLHLLSVALKTVKAGLGTKRQTRRYGSWRSPVTADTIVAGVIGLSQIQLDGNDVYWVESRPAEAGRNVVVRRRPDGAIEDITPAGFNVRTRVHEYGGGAYCVHHGTVWFSHYADQRVYRQEPGRPPLPITPELDIRYADFVLDERRARLIAVREDHSTGSASALNTIVSLPLTGNSDPQPPRRREILIEGNDFYSTPRLSPFGSHLC
jgi:hypothetical protein